MSETEPKIVWSEVTKFVGQLNHDLRNHLNALELQGAFLGEIVENPEAKKEIKRLRELTGEMGTQLQKLSSLLAKIKVATMTYQVAEFVEDLRSRFTREQPEQAAEVEWNISLGAEPFAIDPQLLLEAFLHLFSNAFLHGRGEGPVVFTARSADATIEFTLSEPKKKFEGTTENWGAKPLGFVRHGHYGLGLFRARGIFEAHHGTIRAQFDPTTATLGTTVSLPRLVA